MKRLELTQSIKNNIDLIVDLLTLDGHIRLLKGVFGDIVSIRLINSAKQLVLCLGQRRVAHHEYFDSCHRLQQLEHKSVSHYFCDPIQER